MKISGLISKSDKIYWSSLSESMSMIDRLEIFEGIQLGTLKESNDKNSVEYFNTLSEMSDEPVKGQKYIVVPTALINSRIMMLNEPKIMTFVSRTTDSMTFDGRTQTSPDNLIRKVAVYNVFTFLNKEKYSELQLVFDLRFNVHLPDIGK